MSEKSGNTASEHATADLAPTALAGVPEGSSPTRRPTSLPRYGPVSGPGPLGSPSAFRPRRDGSRSCLESMIAFPVEGAGPVGRPSKFTQADITSGLAEDSRDMDEQELAKREAQRKGRVAAANKALESNQEARKLVLTDQVKLARFCARVSITPSDICPMSDSATERCSWCRGSHGAFRRIHVEDLSEVLGSPCDYLSEVRAREAAYLPGSEA